MSRRRAFRSLRVRNDRLFSARHAASVSGTWMQRIEDWLVLHLSTEPWMHGRVLALHGLAFLGTTPLGGPLAGWICQTWGARAATAARLLVAGISALAAAAPVAPAPRWAAPVVPVTAPGGQAAAPGTPTPPG